MKGIITSIDPKKIIVETTDGDEHTYLPKRLKYKGAQAGDRVIVRKGADGTEIVMDGSADKPVQKPGPKSQPAVKRQPEPRDEEDEEDYRDTDTDAGDYDTGSDYDDYDDEEDEPVVEHSRKQSYDEEDEEEDEADEYYRMPQAEKSTEGLAGFVFSVGSFIGGLIPAVIGLILSKSVKKKTDDDTFANAGYTIGKIMAVIHSIILILGLLAGMSTLKAYNDLKTKLTNLPGITSTYDTSGNTGSNTDDSTDSGSVNTGDSFDGDTGTDYDLSVNDSSSDTGLLETTTN